MNMKVLVLGGAGMLGSAIVRRLEQFDMQATVTGRSAAPSSALISRVQFAVGDRGLQSLLQSYGSGDVVVNCIGLIKHHLDDADRQLRLDAIRVNAEFPYVLAEIAERQGFRVIQIATDCVYSGSRGSYVETSVHDANDVYGKTKSLGEVPSPHFLNLRCSIIGRELAGSTSLIEWILSQPAQGTIRGFTDHHWNGLTTDTFASIAVGLISSRTELSGTFHVIPADQVTKNELVQLVLRRFGREDVTVVPTVTGNAVDRTLATLHPETNNALWDLSEFSGPPTIEQMVLSLA
ncbi:SDR family oxidoreductase [Cryobacterium sp. TMT4-10]|uniref:dTDP-4-dehydrorhamnose reductase family protein n=1 Tax=Cryobacterium sp. TMT4-10 TaxID=1259256 RepID=UPI001069854D|nr:SDR family oxidoreductase [Cryobacterium sp. TMT4-10]TFD16301.1 SDR family oxidoreductase [Cryobacterium sp. TMT4-10]